MTTEIKAKTEKESFIALVRRSVDEKLSIRLLLEFLSSMIFIFCINSILALGEMDVPFFHFFYFYNIGVGIWIALTSIVILFWTRQTTVSAVMINLTLSLKRKEITATEFWSSLAAQFIGGFLGAVSVYALVNHVNHGIPIPHDAPYAMGGAMPKLKGLFVNTPTETSLLNPWMSINFIHGEEYGLPVVYTYAVIQGFINATWIIVAFIANAFVNKKTNNIYQEFGWRYIILLIGVSITTIFSANTTNWIRLLSPAIVNAVVGEEHGILLLNTTFVYIAIQMIGVAIVYFVLVLGDTIEHEHEKEKNKERKES